MTEQTPTLEDPKVVKGTKPRYEIFVGATDVPVGKTYAVDHVSTAGVRQRIFPHTEVDEAYGGHGLASKLVRGAVDASIAEGYRIVAVCPYVKGWLAKHPEYAEHVDATAPEHLTALDAR